MKKLLTRVLAPLFVLFAVLALNPSKAEARCMAWDALHYVCTIPAPELLPGAWDVSPSYAPTEGVVVFCHQLNYGGVGQCQAMSTASYVPNLASYNWYGGQFYVATVKTGVHAGTSVCAGLNYTSCGWAQNGQSINYSSPILRSYCNWWAN